MIRIAFLGCDSTHTEAYGHLVNNPEGAFYHGARVVKIWGEDRAEAERKRQSIDIAESVETVSEALTDVDLAMVIGRFGDSHFEPTRAALERGLPTFVDKPFTTNFREAEQLAELAERSGGRLMSSSPLRFAKELEDLSGAFDSKFVSVAAPANCVDLGDDQRLQSVFFYGIHATEVLFQIMGHDVRRIRVLPGERAITTQVEFPNGTGSVQFVKDAEEFYEIHAYGQTDKRHLTVALDGSYYPRLMKFLLDRFYTGSDTIPIESTLHTINVLEKTEAATLGPE